MQLTTLLVESIKSGKLTISENNIPQVEIRAQNKKIDIDAKEKQLIKEVVSSVRKGTVKGGVGKRIRKGVDQLRAANESRPLVKDIVEDLCREGVTITLSYKGDKVATIGSGADSKLTRFITGTKGIQINSAKKLIELGI